jgi:hypothetical protein
MIECANIRPGRICRFGTLHTVCARPMPLVWMNQVRTFPQQGEGN